MIYKILFKRENIPFFLFLVTCFFSRLNSKFYLIDILGQLSFQILICGIILFFIFLILKRLFVSMICILFCIFLTIDILSSCNRCNAFIEDKSQIHNKIRLMLFNVNHENEINLIMSNARGKEFVDKLEGVNGVGISVLTGEDIIRNSIISKILNALSNN